MKELIFIGVKGLFATRTDVLPLLGIEDRVQVAASVDSLLEFPHSDLAAYLAKDYLNRPGRGSVVRHFKLTATVANVSLDIFAREVSSLDLMSS